MHADVINMSQYVTKGTLYALNAFLCVALCVAVLHSVNPIMLTTLNIGSITLLYFSAWLAASALLSRARIAAFVLVGGNYVRGRAMLYYFTATALMICDVALLPDAELQFGKIDYVASGYVYRGLYGVFVVDEVGGNGGNMLCDVRLKTEISICHWSKKFTNGKVVITSVARADAGRSAGYILGEDRLDVDHCSGKLSGTSSFTLPVISWVEINAKKEMDGMCLYKITLLDSDNALFRFLINVTVWIVVSVLLMIGVSVARGSRNRSAQLT